MITPRASLFAKARSALRGARANFFWSRESQQTVGAALAQWAEQAPAAPFLIFEGTTTSVGEFFAEVCRTANTWRAEGIARHDVVAIVLENEPRLLHHFYGLMQLGAVPVPLNPELGPAALAHALATSGARALVTDANQATGIRGLDDAPAVYCTQTGSGESFEELSRHQSTDPPRLDPALRLGDRCAMLFTSGTTGLPKPAVVKHHRLHRGGLVFGGGARITPGDTLYCCLPLHHASATIIAVPLTIFARCRLLLGRRFSASSFWHECREGQATAFVYVGEMVRYLAQRPPSADERNHGIQRAIGNGLAPEYFEVLRDRFGVRRVLEFYASTEGNAETANVFDLDGTMGPWLPWKQAVVAWDTDAESVIRDAEGRCQRVLPGETGLLLGRIGGNNDFAGYVDPAASGAKVLRNVFRPGDAWFDTGDLVQVDARLHLRFVDRLGDTFRYKGENVSTAQVASVLRRTPGVHEVVVYGVRIPGVEGRVGMAALRVDERFDARTLLAQAEVELVGPAIPRFLRLVDRVDSTPTHKLSATRYRREAIDEQIPDALFVLAPARRRYLPLDAPRRRNLSSDLP